MDGLPSYVIVSPVGLHVLDLETFLHSAHKAPPSLDPQRSGWGKQATIDEISQVFSPTPLGRAIFNIFVYNKTRDVDRICPACRRWYRVGEAPIYDEEMGGTAAFVSFDSFLTRPLPTNPPDLDNNEVAREQDLSGICSRPCMAAMNSGDESQFGLDADQVTPEQISRHSAEIERATGWSIRKTTPEEEASMGGVKILYEKRR